VKRDIRTVVRFGRSDAHVETTEVAVNEADRGQMRAGRCNAESSGERPEIGGKARTGGSKTARYEAKPRGYAPGCKLVKLKVTCGVLAPMIIPVKVEKGRRSIDKKATRFVRRLGRESLCKCARLTSPVSSLALYERWASLSIGPRGGSQESQRESELGKEELPMRERTGTGIERHTEIRLLSPAVQGPRELGFLSRILRVWK